jgi:hypothetical protein
MRIRSEEHRALRGLLPDDVRGEAVRLNTAARERGGESVITPERVRNLGESGVRDVVREAKGDPARAEQRLRDLERVAERAREGRERS